MPKREESADKRRVRQSKDDSTICTPSAESKEGKDSKEKKSDKTEKCEKQTKIDTMLSHISKEEDEPTLKDLVTMVTALDKKMSKLASKEYIEKTLEKRMQSIVTTDFFNDQLQSLKSELSDEIKKDMDKVYEQLRTIKSKLKESEIEITTLKNAESDRRVEFDQMKEECNKLKQRNKDLKDMIMETKDVNKYNRYQTNELEQYTRRNSIRVYGMDDKNKFETPAQTEELVTKLLKDKLNITLGKNRIDVAHRLGRFAADANRPIICKFLYRSDKAMVIRARKALKGSFIVIREDLTLKNARLLEKVSTKEEVNSCWSDEGKIITLLTNGKKVRIDVYTDLSRSLL